MILAQERPQTEDELVAAVGRRIWNGVHDDPKSKLAAQRRTVYSGNFDDLIVDALFRRQAKADIRNRMLPFVTSAMNLPLDLISALAVTYKQGVSRILQRPGRMQIRPDDDKLLDFRRDRAQEAFDRLNHESRMWTLAPEIDRLISYVGPVLEVPRVTANRFVREIYTRDQYEVILDPADPLGHPIGAAYPWWDARRDVDKGGWAVVYLDKTHTRMYRPGKGASGPDMYVEAEHGVQFGGEPLFPATLWRGSYPLVVDDYYRDSDHHGMHRAGIDVGFYFSKLCFIKKAQGAKLISYFGPIDTLAKGQLLTDPEQPFSQDVKGSEDKPELEVHDLDLDPSNWIRMIMFIYRHQTQSKGIPESAVFVGGEEQPPPAVGTLRLQHERLSTLRNQRKPFARENEKRSAIVATAVAKADDWEEARALPTPEQVEERFVLDIPELNRVDDPKVLHEIMDWEVSHGLTNMVDIAKRRNPDMSDREAADELVRNKEITASINDFDASRNQSSNPNAEPGMTAAQANGSMGGRPPSPEGPDDERRDESDE